MKRSDGKNQIRIYSPCNQKWDEMSGSDSVRHCQECNRDIFNITGLTSNEIQCLKSKASGAFCVSYKASAKNEVAKTDKFYTFAQKSGVAVRGALSTALVLSIISTASSHPAPFPVSKDIYLVSSSADGANKKQKRASLAIVFRDQTGEVIPAVQVTLRNLKTNERLMANSNSAGEMEFINIRKGRYEINASCCGFSPFKRKIFVNEVAAFKFAVTLEVPVFIVGVFVDSWSEVPLLTVVANNDVEGVKKLISGGINVNAKDRSQKNMTALHVAIHNERYEIANLLLQAGANPNHKAGSGQLTPLMMSEETEGPPPALIREFISRGVNVNAKSKSRTTILMIAAEYWSTDSVKLLLEAGANPLPKNLYAKPDFYVPYD